MAEKARVSLDRYVVDSLLRDLVDQGKPSAFMIYLYLWHRTDGGARPTRLSHAKMADGTGFSKSSVQAAIRYLMRRKLIRSTRASVTATPEYAVQKPWLRASKTDP